MASNSIDDLYPTPARPDSTWWVVRTQVPDSAGTNTLVAFTPLSVPIHPNKDKAEQYMKDKVAIVKPSEVKIILGPVSREEAFSWCTLNPYVIQSATESAAQPGAELKGGNPDPTLSQEENDKRLHNGGVYLGNGDWAV